MAKSIAMIKSARIWPIGYGSWDFRKLRFNDKGFSHLIVYKGRQILIETVSKHFEACVNWHCD
jgi:hypothetical protein